MVQWNQRALTELEFSLNISSHCHRIFTIMQISSFSGVILRDGCATLSTVRRQLCSKREQVETRASYAMRGTARIVRIRTQRYQVKLLVKLFRVYISTVISYEAYSSAREEVAAPLNIFRLGLSGGCCYRRT